MGFSVKPSRPNKKWNESGFRPPLCTYRLNWARRTSWGWWDDWDDAVLQTQDSTFEPWRSEAEHATSRSRRLPTILTFTRGWGRNIFCFFQTAETGNRTPDSGVKGSGANHYPRAPAPVETRERSPNSSVSDSSANHCAMSPALCECQCGDYDSGLVHQHKPEGRRLTSAIISTPLWSEWPLCIFSHEFIINNFLEPQRS